MATTYQRLSDKFSPMPHLAIECYFCISTHQDRCSMSLLLPQQGPARNGLEMVKIFFVSQPLTRKVTIPDFLQCSTSPMNTVCAHRRIKNQERCCKSLLLQQQRLARDVLLECPCGTAACYRTLLNRTFPNAPPWPLNLLCLHIIAYSS